MVRDILLMVIAVVLLVFMGIVVKMMNNQTIYMERQERQITQQSGDSEKLDYVYDVIKSANEVLITNE